MEQAIARMKSIPEDRQDQVAGLVLNELDEDDRWSRSTGAHADKLRRVVHEILDADRRGQCEPLDPDRL
jgi:hypothetical protein